MSERDTPQHRVEAQAARCRRAWRRLGPEGRAMLALALRPEGPGTARVWAEVLSGEHPLARWLDGDDPLDALPVLLPGGFSPRQLFADHPFASMVPWSSQKTSPASC